MPRRDFPAGLFDPRACRRCKSRGHVHHGHGACGVESCECARVDLTELCLGCEEGDHSRHSANGCDVICTGPGTIGPIRCDCAWSAELAALRSLYEASAKFARVLMAYLERKNTSRRIGWADGLGEWMSAIDKVRAARRKAA